MHHQDQVVRFLLVKLIVTERALLSICPLGDCNGPLYIVTYWEEWTPLHSDLLGALLWDRGPLYTVIYSFGPLHSDLLGALLWDRGPLYIV
jgi:hypothetical protein